MTRDLLKRVPGQSLIEKLLEEWDAGRIRPGDHPGTVVIDEESRGWYWGVLGERRVAEQLARLDHTWTVLHSLPVGAGRGDIDHVAIGPSGVYTLNTKYSPGAAVWVAGRGLLVGGEKQHLYLRASMAENARTTSVLSEAAGFAVPVRSLIVFVAPRSVTVRETPGWDGAELEVIADARLVDALNRRPREMSDEQLSRVLDAALRPETWHRTRHESRPGRQLALEFDALREAVGPALDSTRTVASRPAPGRPSRRPARRPAPVRVAERTPRPPRRRPSSRRRSATGGLIRLATGAAGLFALWFYFTNIYGR